MINQKNLIIFPAVLVLFFVTCHFFPYWIIAGELEPTGPPGPTMHTLNEIYDLVKNINVTGAGIEKTGQTTSYGIGDDGDYEKGLSSLNQRFTDNADGTVRDNLTGLIWLKDANCFGTKTWTSALNDCNSLADGLCGLTDGSSAGDWRLPNVKELQSLVNFGRSNPCLPDAHPFTGVQAAQYWTSTTVADFPDSAWHQYMSYGNVRNYEKTTPSDVWPVRGGN